MRILKKNCFLALLTLFLFCPKSHAQLKESGTVGPGSYDAACYGGQAGFGGIYCPSAGAGVSYKSTIDGGIGYFIAGGIMTFAVSPQDLVGRPITSSGGGYFYVHIDFWDQITGEKVAWFNGGGAVFGGFTSSGHFL